MHRKSVLECSRFSSILNRGVGKSGLANESSHAGTVKVVRYCEGYHREPFPKNLKKSPQFGSRRARETDVSGGHKFSRSGLTGSQAKNDQRGSCSIANLVTVDTLLIKVPVTRSDPKEKVVYRRY